MTPILNEEQTQTLFAALEDMAKAAVWQQSTFLRGIGKQVVQIHDKFQVLMERSTHLTHDRHKKAIAVAPGKMVPIYIALYTTKGTDFNTWLHILNNLPANLISRAIYSTEKAVETAVRSKPNPENEAYLCVEINEAHLITLPPDKTPLDKLKQPLVVLKGHPMTAPYTGIFVHKGIRYKFTDGHLTPIT